MPCQNDDGNQIQGFCLDSLKKKKFLSEFSGKAKHILRCSFFFYELLELFRANFGSSNFFFCAGYMLQYLFLTPTDLRSLHEN